MSDIAIKVEALSKQYRLGKVGTGSLRHDLNRFWHSIRGKEDPYLKIGQTNDRTKKSESEYVWALQDINFEVKKGEVLGIIGRNGAGKSTLLKILSKITAPTTGQIIVNGRIASLLEVGTGFHPELSGRENIFLNGAILGMRKWEIQKKFDEIVDFAGVEAYIDTPVKRYSSGMYVRLAFAVAAFLEPEILIVDEVLAVGDAEFQKKCIGRMKDVSVNDGRTVLFVSHNMQAISALAENCIVMNNGKLSLYESTQISIKHYFDKNINYNREYIYEGHDLSKPRIKNIKINTSHSENIHGFNMPFSIDFTIICPISIKNAALSYQIFNSNNQPVLHILNLNSEISFCNDIGTYKLRSSIPFLRLYPDNYYLVVHFADNNTKTKYEHIEYVCPFEVKVFGEIRDYYWYKGHAVYIEDNKWEIFYNKS